MGGAKERVNTGTMMKDLTAPDPVVTGEGGGDFDWEMIWFVLLNEWKQGIELIIVPREMTILS